MESLQNTYNESIVENRAPSLQGLERGSSGKFLPVT